MNLEIYSAALIAIGPNMAECRAVKSAAQPSMTPAG
jgi:hypothetical protein